MHSRKGTVKEMSRRIVGGQGCGDTMHDQHGTLHTGREELMQRLAGGGDSGEERRPPSGEALIHCSPGDTPHANTVHTLP